MGTAGPCEVEVLRVLDQSDLEAPRVWTTRHARIARAVREILLAIGEDPEREGLQKTPERVAKMFLDELCSWTGRDVGEPLETVFHVDAGDMVVVKDIPFHTLCEHHLVPFFGKAHVGYLPSGQVVGLSKVARVVNAVSRRLNIQERMTEDIADAFEQRLAPKGVIVVVQAEHLCMSMRGIERPGSVTVTRATRGLFREDAGLRQEFLQAVGA